MITVESPNDDDSCSLFAHALSAVPYLKSALVNEACIDRIFAVAHWFGYHCTSPILGFECPFQEGGRSVDLSIPIHPKGNIFQANIAALHHLMNTLTGAECSLWKQVTNLLLTWPMERYTLLGLELDIGSSSQWPPQPNFFLSTKEFQGDRLPLLIHDLMLHLKNATISHSMFKLLDKYSSLCSSSNINLYYCGIMMARPLDGVRIGTRGLCFLSAAGLQNHLIQAGYMYNIQPLLDVFHKIEHLCTKCGVGIDIGEAIEPRIGVEFYTEDWAAVLSILKEEQLLDTEEKEACLSWIGYRVEPKINEHNSDLFVQTINHLKLVFTPPATLRAKIYLFQTYYPACGNKIQQPASSLENCS